MGVAGADVTLESPSYPGMPSWERLTDAEGRFVVSGLAPGSHYECVVSVPERKLGIRLPMVLPSDRKEPFPVEIRLQPLGTVTGRVLNSDWVPLVGATLRIKATVTLPGGAKKEGLADIEELATDAQGRFYFDRLLPGANYRYFVEVSAAGYGRLRSAAFAAHSGQNETLPDLILLAASERVSGRVVDADDRPLANVRVQTVPSVQAGGAFVSGPDATVTAHDGSFVLTGLPQGPVDLEAEPLTAGRQPASARSPLSTRVRVEAGQQNLRIVLKSGPLGG